MLRTAIALLGFLLLGSELLAQDPNNLIDNNEQLQCRRMHKDTIVTNNSVNFFVHKNSWMAFSSDTVMLLFQYGGENTPDTLRFHGTFDTDSIVAYEEKHSEKLCA